jgi:hypothetical protein
MYLLFTARFAQGAERAKNNFFHLPLRRRQMKILSPAGRIQFF